MTSHKTPYRTLALVGNPNTGKTTLFNGLTGLKQKTANYPGVTVEKKTGFFRLSASGEQVQVLDLPGSYGLLPRSPEEEVVRDVLYGWQKDTPRPDFLVVILDANNLERNLFFALQTLELGIPSLWVLNMWDQAQAKGLEIRTEILEDILGVRCVKTIGNKNSSIQSLKTTIEEALQNPDQGNAKIALHAHLPAPIAREVLAIASGIPDTSNCEPSLAWKQAESLRFLSDARLRNVRFASSRPEFSEEIRRSRERLEHEKQLWASCEADARYAYIASLRQKTVTVNPDNERTLSDILDQALTHPIWGLGIFFSFMFLIFQSIFSWASVPMDWIKNATDILASFLHHRLPKGELQSLITEGIIPGVGNVIVFLPQIFLLFFFIALFEDFGYMARATFVLDRLMKKVGLNGKAFLPLLSSFACAIPGIMSTKTIEDRNDRLATILVAPLMSCSARLPVYALMIGAFFPATPVMGFLNLKGLVLFSMYLLSLAAGLGMAGIFRKSLLKGNKTPFLFELPPYRMPNFKTVFLTAYEHAKAFLIRAGSIIFLLSIVLWFLLSHPQSPEIRSQYEAQRQTLQSKNLPTLDYEAEWTMINENESGEILRHSYGGRLGRWIEPVIRPLGFDWKIGIGLVGSFAAREVLVSTLAIVYNVGQNADENSTSLISALQNERDAMGMAVYTPLTALSLMVFFVLACQCISTIAIVRRETLSWKWPLFMVFYMTVLAWSASFLVYQTGKAMGF